MSIQREAINHLKRAFVNDAIAMTLADAQSYLKAKGVPTSQLGKAHIGGWLRQAVLELHDDHVSITSPTGANGWLRDPNASPKQREASRAPGSKYMATRSHNDLRIAQSDAAQIDATPTEIKRAVLLEVAADLLQQVKAITP